MVKFALFSASAGIIEFVTFTLLTELTDFSYWACYLPALILSVLYNFTVNRRFTFKSAANVPVAMLKVAFYYCVFTPLSTWLGNVAAERRVNEYAVVVVTMLFNLLTEYLVCRFWVYRRTMNTNALAKRQEAKDGAKEQARESRP